MGSVEETITKVLGILWNTVTDQLAVKGSKPTECTSKREVLKAIDTVFNLLGFFAPAALQGKPFDSFKNYGPQRKNGMKNWKKRCFINGRNFKKKINVSPW